MRSNWIPPFLCVLSLVFLGPAPEPAPSFGDKLRKYQNALVIINKKGIVAKFRKKPTQNNYLNFQSNICRVEKTLEDFFLKNSKDFNLPSGSRLELGEVVEIKALRLFTCYKGLYTSKPVTVVVFEMHDVEYAARMSLLSMLGAQNGYSFIQKAYEMVTFDDGGMLILEEINANKWFPIVTARGDVKSSGPEVASYLMSKILEGKV